jgi:hypothetical protein
MIANPSRQQALLFRWFAKMGVHTFDLQLRAPNSCLQANGDPWRWLRPSKGMSTSEYFLKFSKWVNHMNAEGSDAYFRPYGEDEQPVIFLDDLPIDKAMRVSRKYASCVVCTSENNTQVWLAIDRSLSKSQRKGVQAHLKTFGYTDPGSVSGDHLGRLCGLKSQKRDCWVNLLATTLGNKYSPPSDLLTQTPQSTPLSTPLGGRCVSSYANNSTPQSQSELDFGWAVGLLKSGSSLESVIEKLCRNAANRGKKCPEHYAQRTAHNAMKVVCPDFSSPHLLGNCQDSSPK